MLLKVLEGEALMFTDIAALNRLDTIFLWNMPILSDHAYFYTGIAV